MRNNHPMLLAQSKPNAAENQVLVIDIVGYLTGLAKLHEAEKTGNLELSVGLRILADTLRPYADAPVSQLPDVLNRSGINRNSECSFTRPKATLPTALDSLGQTEIEGILDNDSYTKEQIADLGVQRFGISKSKLVRLRKEDAKDSIRAALENERALDVISREARISGRARSA